MAIEYCFCHGIFTLVERPPLMCDECMGTGADGTLGSSALVQAESDDVSAPLTRYSSAKGCISSPDV